MYTTNDMLAHPLVSPVMQPTLGGLPPLLILVGGGEVLRDEQIYIAHKCASPSKYLPPQSLLDDEAWAAIKQFRPTDVQLQVWDDLCHVAPTLSFTRPAKHMYRSIAQFGAWALARAQKSEIDILDDGEASVISESGSDVEEPAENPVQSQDMFCDQQSPETEQKHTEAPPQVGKAGDPLPPFENHMIRQRVTRHGVIFPLAPEADLPGCCLAPELIGVPKEGPIGKWMQTKGHWETRFASIKTRLDKKRIKDIAVGYETFGDGELPPPSALAGRRIGTEVPEKKRRRRRRSYGLALWSLWGSKHDEATVARDERAARPFSGTEKQRTGRPTTASASRSRSQYWIVRDENQTGIDEADDNTPVINVVTSQQDKTTKHGFLTPDYVPDTGVTGKRPYVNGIAVPFSLGRDAESASMMTLDSATGPSPQLTLRPTSPVAATSVDGETSDGSKGDSAVTGVAEKEAEREQPVVGT